MSSNQQSLRERARRQQTSPEQRIQEGSQTIRQSRELDPSVRQERQAERLTDEIGSDVTVEDLRARGDRWELRSGFWQDQAIASLQPETEAEIGEGDVQQSDSGWGLTPQARQREAVLDLQPETQTEIDAEDIRETDDGFGLSEQVRRQEAVASLQPETETDIGTEDLQQTESGFGLTGTALKQEAATGTDLFGPSDFTVSGGEAQVREASRERVEQQQREDVFSELQSQTETQISEGDITETGDGFALTEGAQREEAVESLQTRTSIPLSIQNIEIQDGQAQLTSRAQEEIAAEDLEDDIRQQINQNVTGSIGGGVASGFELSPGDIQQTGDGYTLSESGEQAVEQAQGGAVETAFAVDSIGVSADIEQQIRSDAADQIETDLAQQSPIGGVGSTVPGLAADQWSPVDVSADDITASGGLTDEARIDIGAFQAGEDVQQADLQIAGDQVEYTDEFRAEQAAGQFQQQLDTDLRIDETAVQITPEGPQLREGVREGLQHEQRSRALQEQFERRGQVADQIESEIEQSPQERFREQVREADGPFSGAQADRFAEGAVVSTASPDVDLGARDITTEGGQFVLSEQARQEAESTIEAFAQQQVQTRTGADTPNGPEPTLQDERAVEALKEERQTIQERNELRQEIAQEEGIDPSRVELRGEFSDPDVWIPPSETQEQTQNINVPDDVDTDVDPPQQAQQFDGQMTVAADTPDTPGQLQQGSTGLFGDLAGAGEEVIETGQSAVEAGGGVADSAVGGMEAFIEDAQEGITPHATMPLDAEGIVARAEREELFAERAASGVDAIASGELPSGDEIGGMVFQGAELAERGIIEGAESAGDVTDSAVDVAGFGMTLGSGDVGTAAGRAIGAQQEFEEGDIAQGFESLGGQGPSPLGEDLGEVPGNVVEGAIGGVGMGVGAIGQFPVTATADLTEDAQVETQQLEQPSWQTPDDIEAGVSTGEIERRIAGENPGVEPSDIDVTRRYRPGGMGGETGRRGAIEPELDVETDLSEQDQRERIAAQDPDIEPEDVRFTSEGEPLATQISGDGETPSQTGGGFGDLATETAASQVELVEDKPVSTGLLLGLPLAEGVPAGIRGYRSTRGTQGTVRFSELAQERTVESGAIPEFETRRGEPTSRAVREMETRAADQPELVQDLAGTDQVLFHTTGERFGTDLSIAEGRSELPGLFTAGDINPVGLRSSQIQSSQSASLGQRLSPSRPNFRTQPDQMAAFQGDRVSAMPEWASGSGYEVRRPSGEVVEAGIGRRRARELAEGTELQRRPWTETAGYEYLTEQAEPGTAYVRSSSRTPEQEAIFPPESEFARTGNRFAVELPSGERIPTDVFRRVEEQPERTVADSAQTTDTATAEGIGESYTATPTGRTGFTAATYSTALGATEGASGGSGTATQTTDSGTSRTEITQQAGWSQQTDATTQFESGVTSGIGSSTFGEWTQTAESTTEQSESRSEPTGMQTDLTSPFGSTTPTQGTSPTTRSPSEPTQRTPTETTPTSNPFTPTEPPTTPTGTPTDPPTGEPTTPTRPPTSLPTRPPTEPPTRPPTTPPTTPGDEPPNRQRWIMPDDDSDEREQIFQGQDPTGERYENPVASGSAFLFGSGIGDATGQESQAGNILPGGEGTPTEQAQSGDREVQDPFDFGF